MVGRVLFTIILSNVQSIKEELDGVRFKLLQ
jgi:hypothetical protein